MNNKKAKDNSLFAYYGFTEKEAKKYPKNKYLPITLKMTRKI